MGFPLENTDECFNLNYPTCLRIRTKCPHLNNCHVRYSGVSTLLRTVDADMVDGWFFGVILISAFIPIIYIILTFFMVMK